jgi:hypothetical protein
MMQRNGGNKNPLVQSAVNWFVIQNVDDQVIPPRGICAITGVLADGTVTVTRPVTDNQTDVLFNGLAQVGVGRRGQAHQSFPAIVAYDQDPETMLDPANGDVWGTQADSWYLEKSGTGFRVAGDGVNSLCVVIPQSRFVGGTGINQGATAGGNSSTGSTVNTDGINGPYDLSNVILDGFTGLRWGPPAELLPPVVVSATIHSGGSIADGAVYYVITAVSGTELPNTTVTSGAVTVDGSSNLVVPVEDGSAFLDGSWVEVSDGTNSIYGQILSGGETDTLVLAGASAVVVGTATDLAIGSPLNDDAGETMASNEVTATSASANNSVVLVWTHRAGAVSYNIYRSTTSIADDPYGPSSFIANVAVNITTAPAATIGTSATLTYTDGAETPGTGTPPVSGTVMTPAVLWMLPAAAGGSGVTFAFENTTASGTWPNFSATATTAVMFDGTNGLTALVSGSTVTIGSVARMTVASENAISPATGVSAFVPTEFLVNCVNGLTAVHSGTTFIQSLNEANYIVTVGSPTFTGYFNPGAVTTNSQTWAGTKIPLDGISTPIISFGYFPTELYGAYDQTPTPLTMADALTYSTKGTGDYGWISSKWFNILDATTMNGAGLGYAGTGLNISAAPFSDGNQTTNILMRDGQITLTTTKVLSGQYIPVLDIYSSGSSSWANMFGSTIDLGSLRLINDSTYEGFAIGNPDSTGCASRVYGGLHICTANSSPPGITSYGALYVDGSIQVWDPYSTPPAWVGVVTSATPLDGGTLP